MKVVLVLFLLISVKLSFCQVQTKSLPIESIRSTTEFEQSKVIYSLSIQAPRREEIDALKAEDEINGFDKKLRFGFTKR